MLAEDLLVLLYDPATGRPLIRSNKVDLALGGAVLAELTERRRIELTEPHRVTKNRTLIVVDPASTGDEVLDEALQRIAARPSKRSHVVVSRISRGVRGRLLDRLAGRGLLKSKASRFLGLFPTCAWPAADPRHTKELKRDLQQVLRGERPPRQHETTIISLLHAVGGTATVLGDLRLSRRDLKRRAKAMAQGDTAGEAVRQAINAAAF